MTSAVLKETAAQMDRNIEAVQREFTGVRTGKASPALLDSVQVEAYGSRMPLRQTATVMAPEPQMLVVQPWDASLVNTVAKAIQSADLGLNPSVDGNLIRVRIPPLTEERRRDMVKLLHKFAEDGRVAVRHARHKAKSDIEKLMKDGKVGEDAGRRDLELLQKLTDEHIARIDELMTHKEAEVMEV
jgi:ribosome recycling factor